MCRDYGTSSWQLEENTINQILGQCWTTTFISSTHIMPAGVAISSCPQLPKLPPSVPHVKVSLDPGPYYSRELQCHCWYRWSYGPIHPPQRARGLRPRQHCHHFLLLLRCHWWWNLRQSLLCACNDQSCQWWCLGRPSHRWSQGSFQSVGCPSLVWRAAGLQEEEKAELLHILLHEVFKLL